jgi:Uma2 family endonuclease
MPKEALLHPKDEDLPFESHFHNEDRSYLRCVIGYRLPPGWLILSACRVDWGVPGIEPHGPDVSVFKDLRGPKKKWQTFSVGKEKVKPVLVIEIADSSTRQYDLKIRIDEYYRAGVPWYAIVDTYVRHDVRVVQIIGYRSGPTRYETLALDKRGRLLIEPLGLLLGAWRDRVRLWDTSTGEQISTYREIVREIKAIRGRIQRGRRTGCVSCRVPPPGS